MADVNALSQTHHHNLRLSNQGAGALWGISVLIVSIVIVCVVIRAPAVDTQIADKSSRFGMSRHYNIDVPREGFQESYAFPQANYGSVSSLASHNSGL